MNRTLSKIIICLSLIVFAAASIGPLASRFTEPERYTQYTASLDEKTETVLKLMAASTVTSAGISAIPGDTATPIAEKLADFSEYFLMILCVLYAEKYMLTLVPMGVFRGLIPLTCLLFILGRFWNPRLFDRHGMKLLIMSIAMLLVIPLSIHTSDLVYDTYRQSIESTLASAEELSDETAELNEAEAENTGVINSILNKLSETKDTLSDKAAKILNRFVESLAVMIVTSCVIPILVLLFFVWVTKQLTGIDLRDFDPRRGAPRRHDDEEEETQQRVSI